MMTFFMTGFPIHSASGLVKRLGLLLAMGATLCAQDSLEYGDIYGSRVAEPEQRQPTPPPRSSRPEMTPYAYGSEPVATPERSSRVMETSPGRLILPVQTGGAISNPSAGGSPARPPDTHQSTSSPVPYTPVYQRGEGARGPAAHAESPPASSPITPVDPAYNTAPAPQGNVRPYSPQYGRPGSGTRPVNDAIPAPPEAHQASTASTAPTFQRQPMSQPQQPIPQQAPHSATPYTPQYAPQSRPAPGSPHQSLEATIQRQATAPAPAYQAQGRQEALAPGRNPALDEIFRALDGRKPGVQLNIWFPGVQELGNVQVAQGATAAEGIALRLGSTPVFVTSNPGITPGKFNVAIGTVDQLRGLVEERELRSNTDGHLILRQVPNRPDTWLLLIVGRTRQGLDNAILSLGLAREKLPGVATAAIQDIVLPEAPPFLRREPLRAETLYTFQQMQDIGTGMTMLPNRRLRIEFALPGDFSPRYNGDLIMDLHYSHPAFYAQQAGQYGHRGALPRLSAKANDIAEETFYGLSQPIIEGGVRGTITIPARSFRQGDNFIDIEFPGAGTEGFQIFSDSTFSLPAWSVSPSLPNLTLTARTAYPFIGQPDGSEVFVYLAGSEIETVESTWTLLAKLAQVSNTLLYATEFSIAGDTKLLGLNPEARHMIVVGKSASVPADYRVGMPEDIFREILHKSEDQVVIRQRNLKEVIMRWRRGDKDALEDEQKPNPADIEARNPLWKRHERGYLGSFPPVKDRHGWIMLLTAETGLNLRQRTHDLIQPAFWKKVTGASIFWNNTPESLKVYTETPRPRPILSALDEDQVVEMPLGETMAIRTWVIASVATLLFFIVSLHLGLRRKARLRAAFR